MSVEELDPNQEIFVAISAHDSRRLDALLEEGRDPDAIKKDFLRIRPLHAAIAALDDDAPIELLNLLINYGADVNKTYPDIGGVTPLLCALVNGHNAAAFILLNAGADPSKPSEEGDTPLRWCVEERDYDMAEVLLGRGAQATIDSYSAIEGKTALGMAVERLDITMVEILLKAGADPFATDFDHKNARFYLENNPGGNRDEQNCIGSYLDEAEYNWKKSHNH